MNIDQLKKEYYMVRLKQIKTSWNILFKLIKFVVMFAAIILPVITTEEMFLVTVSAIIFLGLIFMGLDCLIKYSNFIAKHSSLV